MIQHFVIGAALGTLGFCIPAWVCVKLLQVSVDAEPATQAMQGYASQETYHTQDNYPQQQ